MKIVVVNSGPRKNCNTAQLVDAFIEGMKEENNEAEIQRIDLYDHLYTGCKSCFVCQMTVNREDLGCRIKDDIYDLLKDTYHADGIVFASPIYYLNVTAQLRAFWERLMYPGPSKKKIPTAMIYTMNMTEEQENRFASSPLQIIDMYLESTFGVKPLSVHSYNTFQYNDRPNLNEKFKRNVSEKKKHHDEHFAEDLLSAKECGKRLVESIRSVS